MYKVNNLEPFAKKPECPKCGYGLIRCLYVVEPYDGCLTHMLLLKCGRCRYSWHSRCKDNKD